MDGGAGLIRPCVASLLSESVLRFFSVLVQYGCRLSQNSAAAE